MIPRSSDQVGRYVSSFQQREPVGTQQRHQRDEVRLLRALARSGVDPVTESFAEAVDTPVSADVVRRPLAAALAR